MQNVVIYVGSSSVIGARYIFIFNINNSIPMATIELLAHHFLEQTDNLYYNKWFIYFLTSNCQLLS